MGLDHFKVQAENAAVDTFQRHTHSSPLGRRMEVTGPCVTDADFHHLSAPRYIDTAHDLTSLMIANAKVTYDGLHTIAEQVRDIPMRNLRELVLLHMKIQGDGILDILEQTPQLVRLELAGLPLRGEFLSELPRLPRLESLYLSDTNVTDRGIRSLARFSRLKFIEIDEPNVDNAALLSLHGSFKPSLLGRLFGHERLTIRRADQERFLRPSDCRLHTE